ncbi:hypothetical protein [Salinimicrobium sp. WS361]|uniref:hypothetical protein n=1 Tax=Salinimicrobium sp. WS361 TaxID=3425123 RepID=UPI003D6E2C7F
MSNNAEGCRFGLPVFLLHVAGYMFCPATGFCCYFEGAFLRLRNLLWNGKLSVIKVQKEVLKMAFLEGNTSEVLRVEGFSVAGYGPRPTTKINLKIIV